MLSLGSTMEDQTEAAMNAQANQASFMAGGPLFDNSDIATAPALVNQRQRPRNYTPIRFDLDSSHPNESAAYEQNSYVAGGSSAIPMGILQVLGGMETMPCYDQGALANYSRDYGQARITQVTPSSANHLRRLPDNFAARSQTEQMHDSGQQEDGGSNYSNTAAAMSSDMRALREITERLCKFADTMMQLEASRQQRDEDSRKLMETSAKIMTDYVEAQNQRAIAKEERIAKDRQLDLELKLTTGSAAINDPYYNWMFGHGVAPRTGKRKTLVGQTKFDKLKNNVRSNALWFLLDASDHELSQPFIQFNDTPRASLDGKYVKKFLMGEVDVTAGMAFALVRTLRRDENFRYPGAQGECHYVVHTWAQEVMTPGSTVESCEAIFTQPMLQYALGGCTRVVAFVSLDDGLASVSMDFKKGTTLLIHPAAALAPPAEVLAARYAMMNTLTLAAQAHMSRLGQVSPPEKIWQYDVALSGGPLHCPTDMGTATAFYSIPKDA